MKKPFIPLRPKPGQEQYCAALNEKDIVFVSGNAGSGKTCMAINEALRLILSDNGKIQKLCVIRPYIFAAFEKIGALPGTLEEKISPFVESIRDTLEEILSSREEIDRILRTKVEFLTLSTLRGRSLHNRFVLVEEAQNVPLEGDGMLTILTRLGKNSKMVIAGDLSQCDIHPRDSGFLEAINALKDLNEVAYVEMNDIKCIYRNKIIGKVLEAFNNFRKRSD